MSEEKTRIVPRPTPKAGGASITFHCDKGHRIVVPVKLAGKRGTCSKCGIPVVIPLATSTAAEPSIAPIPSEPSPAPLPSETGVAPLPADASPAPPRDAVDSFANLFEQGPTAQPTVADEIVVDVGGAGPETLSGGSSAVGDVVAGYAPEDFAAPNESDGEQHPTAQLVARLWVERAHGGIVELHLAGGSIILPEWYEARWSRGTHGLFASQAADGTVTLTAVAWDSIQKIVVRQVEGLPDGMFE